MITTLVHAPNSGTGEYELARAARAAGLEVHCIPADAEGGIDVDALIGLAGPATAFRSAGGPLAAAIAAGARIRLAGASAEWFTALPIEVTGREWSLVDPATARDLLRDGPVFVKLADSKFLALPARRYRNAAELNAAMDYVHAPAALQLLATSGWLALDSEYRVFTLGREVVTCSPYLVQDDPWTPLLRTHRASFHEQAARFVDDLLAALPAQDVPPTAVLDVARLQDGRFALLEVNHVWSSGLYGCDPDQALRTVLAAASVGMSEPHGRWSWQPDPATGLLHR